MVDSVKKPWRGINLAIYRDGMTGWFCPTEEQLAGICEHYGIPLEPLRSMMEDHQSDGTHTVYVDVAKYLETNNG